MTDDGRELHLDSPVGPLVLAANRAGLTHLLYARREAELERHRRRGLGDGSVAAARWCRTAADQLDEYFAGRRRTFDLPLAPAGTGFQRAVWTGLSAIPYGTTLSYAELARRCGRPAAVRAVGAANGANPVSIIGPCHRVVGADGRLTGYGGGLPAKRLLLLLEGLCVVDDRVIPGA